LQKKNVLLVGNSSSLLNKNQGGLIDSYDIVVRFNHGYPRNEFIKDTGSKTDIWICQFNNMNNQLDRYNKFNAKFNIRYNPCDVHENIKDKLKICNVDFDKTKNHPTTGYLTIYFFLNNIKVQKSLTIIGFDSFDNKFNYYEADRTDEKRCLKNHDLGTEKENIQRLISENKISHK